MTPEYDFRRGVVKPVECIKEGWALIKDQYWLFLGIVLVTMLIAGAVPIVLMGPMMVGMFMCFFRRMRGEPVEFGMLFKGFDHFLQGLIAALIQMIPFVVVMIPAYFIMALVMIALVPKGGQITPDQSATFAVAFLSFYFIFILLVVVMAIAIGVFFMFSFPLIADKKLSGLDAVKLSIRAGKANFGGVLGLLLLGALLGFVGVLACYVGAFFVLPITFAAHAVAYRRVFPDVAPSYPTPPPPPASWA